MHAPELPDTQGPIHFAHFEPRTRSESEFFSGSRARCSLMGGSNSRLIMLPHYQRSPGALPPVEAFGVYLVNC